MILILYVPNLATRSLWEFDFFRPVNIDKLHVNDI